MLVAKGQTLVNVRLFADDATAYLLKPTAFPGLSDDARTR